MKKREAVRHVLQPARATEPLSNCIAICSMPLGEVPQSLLDAVPRALLIAVDGGVGHFANLGAMPDVWIGDGDSVPKRFSLKGFPKIKLPRSKEFSDLEFALRVAGQMFFEGKWEGDLILLGAQGGRLDHEVVNMLVAQNWLREMSWAVGPALCPEVVSIGTQGVWIATMHSLEFRQPRGKVFSVLTLDSELKVSIKGAKYSVTNRKLGVGSLGLSNVGLGKDVKITIVGSSRVSKGPRGPVFVLFP